MATALDPHEQFLVDRAAEFRHDPLGFVLFSIPDLELYDWQVEVFKSIGQKLQAGHISAHEAILEAVSSGHGIGKSAFVALLVLWAICTRVDTKGVVTANTETQLKTKTWAELAKWYSRWRYKHWFTLTATALYSVDESHAKTWRIDQVPWSERNTEAFAGMHNAGKRVLLVMDEASAILDTIWEVSEGALTDVDTEILWIAFGNPTRPQGRFFDCFNRLKHRWSQRQIDSRAVPGTNKRKIQDWIDDYGEDSDFVRVRVRGVFPRAGATQFIGSDLVLAATKRDWTDVQLRGWPVILGLDVARHGDDQSVLVKRKGNKVWPLKRMRVDDTMRLAEIAALAIDDEGADALFVDATGIGWGVVDRLRQLGYGNKVFAVQTGESAADPKRYHNKRAEVWGRIRDWLKEGGALPPDPELESELTGPEYYLHAKSNAIIIESKEDMKSRGLASPDGADAICLTFAQPISPDSHRESSWRDRLQKKRHRHRSAMSA